MGRMLLVRIMRGRGAAAWVEWAMTHPPKILVGWVTVWPTNNWPVCSYAYTVVN